MGKGMEIVVEFERRMEVCSGERPLFKSESHLWLIVLGEPIHPLLFLGVNSLRNPWTNE